MSPKTNSNQLKLELGLSLATFYTVKIAVAQVLSNDLIKISDAESLPITPNKPELVEDFLGVYVEDGGDDPGDEDFLPSQGQESGSSATFLNPSSQHIEVSVAI